ncbi:hypothetical protein HanIR_Chr16g0843751 [Helianthus annuus]|nr:hypothetical protein HanIR_Chr16g0843751 [Helianthus annuus]
MGRKCADLVSLSTITHIVSFPFFVFGNLVMKSIVTISHFHSEVQAVVASLTAFGVQLSLAHKSNTLLRRWL